MKSSHIHLLELQ